jgi:hypothetical protein
VPNVNFTEYLTAGSNSTEAQTNQQNAESLINWKYFSADKLVAWIGDLNTCAPIIAASAGIALAIVLIYLILMRYIAAILAYTSILMIFALFIVLGSVFHSRISYYQNLNDEQYVLAMKVLGGLFYTLAGIWFILIIYYCNSIRLSIALIQASARYVSCHLQLFLQPIFMLILTVAYFIYWVALSIYIYSTGTILKNNSFIANLHW